MEAKFKEIAGAADVILINIEGGTGACAAFNTKHSLTLPHYGLKDKGEIGPFGVQTSPTTWPLTPQAPCLNRRRETPSASSACELPTKGAAAAVAT